MSALLPKADMCGALVEVCFGSKADICGAKKHVRFTPESRHVPRTSRCPLSARSGHCGPLAPSHPPTYGVEIRPVLVATIRRLPHRKIETILPTPGTVSPRVTCQVLPLGPSNTAVPFITSRSVQPSMVAGLVSGTGANFTGACRARDALGPIDVGWCSASFNNLRIESAWPCVSDECLGSRGATAAAVSPLLADTVS